MIKLTSKEKDYSLLIPTTVSEITNDAYVCMLNKVKLAPHYAIIALVHKLKLFELASTVNAKRDVNIKVVPILAKINIPTEQVNTFNVGERVIISRSSLEMGDHLNVSTNDITLTNVNNYIDADKELRSDIMTGIYFQTEGKSILDSKRDSPECCFIEFKVVPVSSIRGTIPVETKRYKGFNPFKEDNEVCD